MCKYDVCEYTHKSPLHILCINMSSILDVLIIFTMQKNSSYHKMLVQPFLRKRGSKMDGNVPGTQDLMQDANFLTMKKISKKKKNK